MCMCVFFANSLYSFWTCRLVRPSPRGQFSLLRKASLHRGNVLALGDPDGGLLPLGHVSTPHDHAPLKARRKEDISLILNWKINVNFTLDFKMHPNLFSYENNILH